MIQNLNDKLPQPFVANSDELQQVLNNVKYRLAPGFGLGVIQALRSPWSPRHVILVVSGSDADSESRASSVLLDPNTTFNQLLGDVIFVSQNAISPIDSRFVRTADGALTAVPALSTESSLNTTGTAVSMAASGTIPPSPTAPGVDRRPVRGDAAGVSGQRVVRPVPRHSAPATGIVIRPNLSFSVQRGSSKGGPFCFRTYH